MLDLMAQAREICPSLEYVHTPGAGHLIRSDSPEPLPYASATRAFLARIYGPQKAGAQRYHGGARWAVGPSSASRQASFPGCDTYIKPIAGKGSR